MDGGHYMHSVHHTMNIEHMGHSLHDPNHGDSGSHDACKSLEGEGVGGGDSFGWKT